MWKLALRNVFRHRARSAMTLTAIGTGVIALVLSGGFIADIYLQLGEFIIHSQSGHIQIAKGGFFSQGSRSPEEFLLDHPEALRKVPREMPEVIDTMTRISFSGLINNGRTDFPIVGEGIEAEKESRLGSFITITDGRQMTDRDIYGILLGHGVAGTLKVKPNDRVTLIAHTTEGAVNTLDLEVVGVFQSFLKDYDARVVRISIQAAQELLNTSRANTLVLSLKRTTDTDRVSSELRSRLGEGLEVKTWYELNDFYAGTVALYKRQFGLLQFIILFMLLLTVANTVNMSAFERTGEFGTLMALGDKNRKLFRQLVLENSLLGLLGASGGVALGVLLAWSISVVGISMPPPPNSNSGFTAQIQIVPSVLAMAFATGLVATILAALFAARRVFKLKVAAALRENV